MRPGEFNIKWVLQLKLQKITLHFPVSNITDVSGTALRERRPPWPKQINPYFAKEVMNVEPLWWKANPKGSGSLPATRSDHATAGAFCSFTQLRRPDHYQNLMFFIVPLGHLHKTSSKSVHNVLSNVMNKQTDRQTFTTKNTTSFIHLFDSLNNNKHSRFGKLTHTCDFHGLQLVKNNIS